jgi:hypothetical protein
MLLLQLFERLQCWYYWWEGFMKLRWPQASIVILRCLKDDWFMNSSSMKVITWTIWEAAILVLLTADRRDILSMLWRWSHVALYANKVSWQFLHTLSKRKVFASTVWEAAILVVLIGRIYVVCCIDGPSYHDVHMISYDGFMNSGNIKVITSPIW